MPEALGVGGGEDFGEGVVFRELGWWDSLVMLRLLDYLETQRGKPFPWGKLEGCQTWGDLRRALEEEG